MFFTNTAIQMVLALLVFLYYMVSFFVLGYTFERGVRKKENVSLSFSLIIGFFIYYSIFEAVALPMKIIGCSFNSLKWTWLMAVLVFMGFCLIINRKFLKKEIDNYIKKIRRETKWYILFFLLILINFIIVISITPETMGVRDDSYYIADIMTSISTNTIQKYDALTGQKLNTIATQYFIPMYPMHGAVIGSLINLHPIIENKWCSVLNIIILSNLVFYLIAQKIYKNNKNNIFKILYLLTILNFNYILWGKASATFYFFRISEGKGILANLILPCLILVFWELDGKDSFRDWITLEFVVIGSFTICMSSMFLVPIALGCLMVPSFFAKRKTKILIPFALSMTTCLFVMIIYEMLRRQIIQIPVI